MARYVFSRILQASATSGLETGTTWTTTLPYRATASSRLAGSRPPTTLGMVGAEN